jgi:hypothetical protein
LYLLGYVGIDVQLFCFRKEKMLKTPSSSAKKRKADDDGFASPKKKKASPSAKKVKTETKPSTGGKKGKEKDPALQEDKGEWWE